MMESVAYNLVRSPVDIVHISFSEFHRLFADIALPFLTSHRGEHRPENGETNHSIIFHSSSCLSHESFSLVNLPLYLHHPFKSLFQNLQFLHSSIILHPFSHSDGISLRLDGTSCRFHRFPCSCMLRTSYLPCFYLLMPSHVLVLR